MRILKITLLRDRSWHLQEICYNVNKWFQKKAATLQRVGWALSGTDTGVWTCRYCGSDGLVCSEQCATSGRVYSLPWGWRRGSSQMTLGRTCYISIIAMIYLSCNKNARFLLCSFDHIPLGISASTSEANQLGLEIMRLQWRIQRGIVLAFGLSET